MTFPCPRCNAVLEQDGELVFEGKSLPVFQCKACKVAVDMFGERMQVQLTFCVDAEGRAFDPAMPDGSFPPAA